MKELTIKKLRDFIDNINGDAKVCRWSSEAFS